ncbi:MAG: Gfo/Idh/MocA family protein [Caldisericum sp.]|uniref:Gfo/Idh/MocA family protein n=2 Tax=Caldisericaceae TaxID=693073 RepID=UPI003C75A27C
MKNINYALIGLGAIAKNHLIAIKSLPIIYRNSTFTVNLKTLYTTHREQKESLGKLIGFENVVDDLEYILRDPDIDVVDICTPNYLHFEEALESINHGKNVYCEKPLTMNSIQAKELVDLAQGTSLKNQVALVYRFMRAVSEARAIIKSGIIGEVNSFHFEMLHSGYLNPLRPISWRLEKNKSGGGAIVDLGVHLVDLVRFLIGEIVRVSAFAGTTVKRRKLEDSSQEINVDVDDWGYIMVETEYGAKGVVEVSRVAVGNDRADFVIYCSEGAIKINSENPNESEVFDKNGKRIYLDEKILKEEPFFNEVKNIYPDSKLSMGKMVDLHYTGLVWFFKSLIDGFVPLGTPTFEEAYKDQIVIESIYKSIENNGDFVNI